MKKNLSRKNRVRRVRAKIVGTAERPRLCVFRSLNHVYAQVIDDSAGKVLVSMDGRKLKNSKNSIETSGKIGEEIAKMSIEKGIKSVVFDKRGYKYHGKVKALADGARKGGLIF
ncbi:MAG: 50S ribosomal protein L18 [Candidatus Moranbacteria bacterium]|nr:50S ribosomal protein L18 [Candidatus Moranbacteria bacterium]